MKSTALCFLYLMSYSFSFSQNNSYVDVVPSARDCEDTETLEDEIRCSEELLKNYFLQNIDTLACPTSDSSVLFNITLDVDKKGRYTASLRQGDKRISCYEHILDKAETMPSIIKLFPAELDDKAVPFKKRIRFFYPPQEVPLDSTGNEFKQLESMPRFYDANCENMIGGDEDKNICAKQAMLVYIYTNLKYPEKARENGVEGMVVNQFVIDKQGYLKDIVTVRDIGDGCGDSSLKIIEDMNSLGHPPFVPGVFKDEAVEVRYTLPTRYKLEKSKRRKRSRRR